MTNTPSLGRPLAVMRDTELCEHQRHEVTIVTDGAHFYAFGDVTDVDAVVREAGNTYEGRCGQPTGSRDGDGGDPCDGTVVWDLSRDSVWTSDPQSIENLVRFGVQVERGDSLGDGE